MSIPPTTTTASSTASGPSTGTTTMIPSVETGTGQTSKSPITMQSGSTITSSNIPTMTNTGTTGQPGSGTGTTDGSNHANTGENLCNGVQCIEGEVCQNNVCVTQTNFGAGSNCPVCKSYEKCENGVCVTQNTAQAAIATLKTFNSYNDPTAADCN